MFDFTLATYSSLFHLESITASAITPTLGLVLVYAAKPKSFSSFVSQCIDYTLHVCLLAALPMGLVWVSMGMFAILTLNENFATIPPEATGTMLITGVVAGIFFCAAVLGRNQNRPIYVPRLSNKAFLLVLLLLFGMHHFSFFTGNMDFAVLYSVDFLGIPLLFLLGFFTLSFLRTQNAATALEHASAAVTCLFVVVALIFWFFASGSGELIVGISRLDSVVFATLTMQWGCLLFAVSQLMKLGPCYEDKEYEIPEALKYLVEACTFFIFLVFTPRF